MSDACFAKSHSPWPTPFPPSPPRAVVTVTGPASAVLCSGTSPVLWGSQTPWSVHRWRAPIGFPPRPPWGGLRASRFSRMVLTRMLGVSAYDRARSLCTLPFLGAVSMAFGSGNSLGTWKLNSISRLNTRPTCAPVNASGTSLQACPHDSGSSWVASPSKCESLLRYTMPVYPGASPGTSCFRKTSAFDG